MLALLIGIAQLSTAKETICRYKNVGSEIEIVSYAKEGKKSLSILIKNDNGGLAAYENSGPFMGCLLEGLAVSLLENEDQTEFVDDVISVRFENKGSEVFIICKDIAKIKLSRLEAIEMVKTIAKYYGFSVSVDEAVKRDGK